MRRSRVPGTRPGRPTCGFAGISVSIASMTRSAVLRAAAGSSVSMNARSAGRSSTACADQTSFTLFAGSAYRAHERRPTTRPIPARPRGRPALRGRASPSPRGRRGPPLVDREIFGDRLGGEKRPAAACVAGERFQPDFVGFVDTASRLLSCALMCTTAYNSREGKRPAISTAP